VLIRSPRNGAYSRRNTGLGLLQVVTAIKRRQPGTLGSYKEGRAVAWTPLTYETLRISSRGESTTVISNGRCVSHCTHTERVTTMAVCDNNFQPTIIFHVQGLQWTEPVKQEHHRIAQTKHLKPQTTWKITDWRVLKWYNPFLVLGHIDHRWTTLRLRTRNWKGDESKRSCH
jgi:hypothetical protein